MEDNQQEYLLKKAKQGDRARIVLEELDQFFKEIDANTLTQLIQCTDEKSAYKAAVTYQIGNRLRKKLQSSVTQANSAIKELTKD